MNYKEYEKINLGYSDIAALVCVGCNEEGAKTELLKFGEDGNFNAYIVDESAEIGAHYSLITTFNYWLRIYDDCGRVYSVTAKEIKIYRAGLRGCIIQVIK